MKLLVLLAVLGAVSAQYRLYTGVSPYYNRYNAPLTYAAHPLTHAAHPLTHAARPATYAAHPLTYAAHPYYYGALPYSFKPAEEKAVDDRVSEEKLAVESRSKRSAEEDQKADDATFVTTYAAHPFTYTAGYPYNTYPASTVYNAYNPLPYNYHGCYGIHGCTVYNGYTNVVHSVKKRDTSAAEDQKAEDATFVSTYATHPLTYTAGYPYTYTPYSVPSVYNAAPVTYSGFPYNYPITYRTVY